MEYFFNRYRNLTVLLLVIAAQLVLLAFQIRGEKDMPLIRSWAVTGITPLAKALESLRGGVTGFFSNYVHLVGVEKENERLSVQVDKLKMENQFLRKELATADRAQTLSLFQSRSPSRTVAARIVGTGSGANSRVVFIDRGANHEVAAGMAVITPDGIVGKVRAAYPAASQVVLITDPSFAAGVVTEKHSVPGTLKGRGHGLCLVDHVQNEEKVEAGEWIYTSGDDRVFPRGLPVGQVQVAKSGRMFKELLVLPSGLERGLEEVLVVIEGVHQPLPGTVGAIPNPKLLPPPPPLQGQEEKAAQHSSGGLSTDADRLRERYQRSRESQERSTGETPPGSTPSSPPQGEASSQPAPQRSP